MVFSGAGLDRAAVARRDPDWIASKRAQPHARSLVVSAEGVWVEAGRLVLVSPNGASAFLGLAGERPIFAMEAEPAEPAPGRPAGLRDAASELSLEEAALGAYATSLMGWHRRHGFCANCGAPTEPAEGGHLRHCDACGASHFPRTDPVIIVGVTDDADRLLLGRQRSWPEGRFSVLAGFVEQGETLEEAVRREVLEESGVHVGEVRYEGSQPWPFPSSLMTGFRARAAGGEPHPADGELAEVCWFGRPEVRAAAEGEGGLRLPPGYAISRRLIDGWLAEDARR